MSEQYTVCIVIPAFNAASCIGEQLQALVAQTYAESFEVIVADNGSTDDTAAVVTSFFASLRGLRIVDASATKGAGFARSFGAASTEAPIIAYCDADDVASPGWLDGLMLAIGQADLVGGVLEHRLLNDAAYRIWRGEETTEELARPLRFLEYAISANMAVRKNVVIDIGWSDEFPYGGDDIDFSWRAQIAGYRIAFAPEATMHYRHRPTVEGVRRQAYTYGRAEPRLYAKFKSAGARPNPPRDVFYRYWYVLSRLPYLALGTRRRGLWCTVAAGVFGRARASFELRVICL